MHFHIYRAMLGRVLWHLGYPDRALHMVRQAIAAADESGHPFTLTDVFQWAAVLHQLRREAGPTVDAADAALTLANEHIFPFLAAHATTLRGWALIQQGCGEEGIDAIRRGIDADRRTGANIEDFFWQTSSHPVMCRGRVGCAERKHYLGLERGLDKQGEIIGRSRVQTHASQGSDRLGKHARIATGTAS